MRADYEELHTIGQGAFGTIIKVRKKCDGQICAMKIIQINQFNESARTEALNEVRIIRDFSCPYIIKYIDSFIEESFLYIIMEYCVKGDLSRLINPKSPSLQENSIWEIFLQVCLGIEFLHANKILHRDIKLQNIFLYDNKSIRIGDLGISKVLASTTQFTKTLIGTPYYFSPEMIKDKPYSYKSDIWALGCLLYELCTFKRPFESTNWPILISKITKGTYAAIPNHYSLELRQLIRICLKIEAKQRPDIRKILTMHGVREKIKYLNIKIPDLSILAKPKLNAIKLERNQSLCQMKAPTSAKSINKKTIKPFKSDLPIDIKPDTAVFYPLFDMNGNRIDAISQQEICINVMNNPQEEKKLNSINSPEELCDINLHTREKLRPLDLLSDSSSEETGYVEFIDMSAQVSPEAGISLLSVRPTLQDELNECQNREIELNANHTQRKTEIISKIGVECFNILYSCIMERFSNTEETTEHDEAIFHNMIQDIMGGLENEIIIYEISILISLESEKKSINKKVAEIKNRML